MLRKLENLPSPWPQFLEEIDKALTAPVELHCLGGFVLTLLYGIPRPTDDLDYISVVPRDAASEIEELAGRQSRLYKKYKLFLQNVVGVSDFPENYEERLTKLDSGFSKLSLKIFEPYDLALSKLIRNSPKDREDAKLLAAVRKLSFRILRERIRTRNATLAAKSRPSSPDAETLARILCQLTKGPSVRLGLLLKQESPIGPLRTHSDCSPQSSELGPQAQKPTRDTTPEIAATSGLLHVVFSPVRGDVFGLGNFSPLFDIRDEGASYQPRTFNNPRARSESL